ncbi:Immunoglobulin subtype 2 domain and Immunoglobulin subtype domain and Fibronectin, type III domain and Immunoglobulin-like domain and Immunoglobulin I-set domain and Immunoglobulin V-set domain and Immunoglobulin-like fold domain-containing protein [Strongyloides ratti]|uniref:Uncharacterized protein n=1 Tax=Strongyloides ratti TaxID=34506 RepID=A0A090N0R8_STRRB|nr:Immunoglobulin subtype 2 domain and Immunoglobulin subtype domain and Fibronectin, type III domain and Immunoglobulin-like domain and Immunoglobulin I-set domain and Immunoglobulin V-set domain and Immunoglobulin-like fold domain-containing protein [Strongyloides ratti]CEF71163.1 Immunoglobulin subtype 2 domain and Immunoglobulin subtype domain and Fibronectin, type III domain and Immunoglobulin-like domain and Immunoglobulin I-set domain and Immunoglobulin V-set domain and Immunoglobulin-like 
MKTSWIQRNSLLTLNCDVFLSKEDGENYTLEWRKDNKLIFSAYGNEDSGHSIESMQGRLARASNLSLTIHSVDEADKGIYQCIVTKYNSNSLNERVEGEKIHVIVHFKPIILSPKPGIEDEFHFMNLGQPFSYECKIQSLPPAEINWTKDDRIIASTANLSFPILKPEHQGIYTCVAVNVDGTEKSNLRLALSRIPIIDTILENKTVIEGESVHWNCKAQAVPKNITYNWLFEKINIKKKEIGLRTKWINDGEIEIFNITKKDKGIFTCLVDNGIQEPVKMNVFLDVLYKPFLSNNINDGSNIKTIVEGNDDKIECNFLSNPPIHQVIWRKNGIVISNNSNEIFNINKANENDSGIYSCQGFNELGLSQIYETHIIIISLPRFTKIPPPKFSINKGDNLILECDGFASPPPLQYWLRNGKKTYSSKIVIERVEYEDYGIYECILSSQDLMVKKTTEVFIMNVKPQPCSNIITDCQFYPKTITTINWTPGFDGGRSQTFKVYWRSQKSDHWFTNHLPTTNLTASFDDLNKFTEYEIKIESQNMYGKVISQPFKIYSCGILMPPTQIDFINNFNILKWHKVNDAEKYKISYRTEKMKSFVTLSVISQTNYTLPEFLRNQHNTQIYIQSLRSHYHDSVPSTVITINSTTINCSLLFILLFGGIILLIIIFFLFIYKRKCYRIFKYFSDTFYSNDIPNNNIKKCNVIERNSCASKSSWNFQQQPYEYNEGMENEKMIINNTFRSKYFNQPSNENTLSSKINREWLLYHINTFNNCPSNHSTSSSSLQTISHPYQIPTKEINKNERFIKEFYNETNYITKNFTNNPYYSSSKTVLTETPVIAMMKDKYIHSGGTIDSLNYLQELRVKQLKHEYNQNNTTTFTEENKF